MGYEIPKRTAVLTFKGTDYDGAEIKVRLNVGLGFFLEMQGLAGTEQALELYGKFAQAALMEWNLEDGGKKLPPNEKGMLAIPPALANIIINSWVEAMAQPPTPLSKPSDDGNMSEELTTVKAKR